MVGNRRAAAARALRHLGRRAFTRRKAGDRMKGDVLRLFAPRAITAVNHPRDVLLALTPKRRWDEVDKYRATTTCCCVVLATHNRSNILREY